MSKETVNFRPLYLFLTTIFILNLLATFIGCSGGATNGGDPLAQQAYVKASNTDGGDEFGFSTALSDDYLAVGVWVADVFKNRIGIDQLSIFMCRGSTAFHATMTIAKVAISGPFREIIR